MKTKRNFAVTGILFLLFILFTVAVATFDVRPIGPDGSSVGFAAVNGFFFETFGVNDLWYEITDLAAYAAIGTALAFAAFGLIQLIKGKSLAKVDKKLLVTGGFYVAVAVAYVFFEIFVVNFRPVLTEDGLEASYPSSHTMLVICIMASAMILFSKILKSKKTATAVNAVIAVIILLTVVGRLLSGAHWFTDILGGVLLSAALISLYRSVLELAD